MKSLGKKMEDCPSAPSPSEPSDVYYPSLYIDSKEPLSIPEKGEARIRFIRRKKSTETTGDGETSYCYVLDVVAIGEAEADKTPKRDRYAEMDELMEETLED